MRVMMLLALCLSLLGPLAFGADAPVAISVFLVDAELNVKAVPRHALVFTGPQGTSVRAVTGLDGKVEVALPPGDYKLESERPLDFQRRSYKWSLAVTVKSGEKKALELSTDNAVVTELAPAVPVSDLPSLFKEWEGSVVTVWSDLGRGTGFVVDDGGLIMTNQHVIHLGQYVAVQFDEKTKVMAVAVAEDPERDIAVLWVSPKAVAGHKAVKPMFDLQGVEEGHQVFTIGSPLSQRKVMTTGIISRIEARAIISDININHGNSGGPLFSMAGDVLGITTFGDFTSAGGPGISGVIRMSEATSLLEKAREVMRTGTPPDAAPLPVEPRDPYPPAALKDAVASGQIDPGHYVLGTGDFSIQFITPVLQAALQAKAQAELYKEQAKRAKKAGAAAPQNSVPSPLGDLRNWGEYVGDNRAVLFIQATPKLKEGFWGGLARGLAEAGGNYGGPAKLKFSTDFVSMKLLCGSTEVPPIHPGRIEYSESVANWRVKVHDAAYAGFYTYPADAIGPHCSSVTLQLVSLKKNGEPQAKEVSAKIVTRIWQDFDPLRKLSEKQIEAPAKSE
jgi:S1-C subfamily serine protease